MKLMINEVMNVGDLVYLPSEVLLRGCEGFIKTKKPINVLCVGTKNIEIKVLYNGSSWWVNKYKAYKTRE
tara:strand:+ start:376 stop:585 length:210 start_codon:yes stop_codon:yes gene_type:complete